MNIKKLSVSIAIMAIAIAGSLSVFFHAKRMGIVSPKVIMKLLLKRMSLHRCQS